MQAFTEWNKLFFEIGIVNNLDLVYWCGLFVWHYDI